MARGGTLNHYPPAGGKGVVGNHKSAPEGMAKPKKAKLSRINAFGANSVTDEQPQRDAQGGTV